MDDKERLYLDSLTELSEALGHSYKNPLSLSLLCIIHGISFDQKGEIFVKFNFILRKYEFDDLKVNLFKDAMVEVIPEAISFSEVVVIGFIKAYAKNLIPELYPFAMTL